MSYELITGDLITQNSVRIRELVNPDVGIPVTYKAINHDAARDFEKFDNQFDPNPNAIYADALPDAVNAMFAGNDVLAQTLNCIGFQGDIRNLNMMHLQTGYKAYILLGQAFGEGNKPSYFVTYLSREPEGMPLSLEAEADFKNLKALKAERDKRLKPEYSTFFDVVDPIAFGHTAPLADSGKKYAFFTMPLVENYGEMHFDLEHMPGGLVYPYFKHAYNVAPAMAEASNRQYREGPIKVLKGLLSTMSGFNGVPVSNATELRLIVRMLGKMDIQDHMYEHPKIIEAFKRYYAQRSLVLGATGVMYYLAGQRLPNELEYNAGDLMTRFYPDGNMLFNQITVRGGWSKQITENEWIEHMLAKQERVWVAHEDKIALAPFCFSAAPEDLYHILKVARHMLK